MNEQTPDNPKINKSPSIKPLSKKTFDNQHILPLLPVPGLNETCDKFIEWLQPLLTDAELINTKKIVDAFRKPGGNGERLQKKLIEWSQRPDVPNWLEHFWNQKYLQSRLPVAINVNFATVCDENPAVKTLSQVERSAVLIFLSLVFKSLLDKEELEVDHDSTGPLCMMQFKKLFSTTRIPQRNADLLRSPISKSNPTSPSEKHIIVLHHGHIFRLEVVKDSRILKNPAEIKQDLEIIFAMGAENAGENENPGILTTLNRDDWADTREALLRIHPQNKASLDTIETSLFALCLDDSRPDTLGDRFRDILHGDGKNRWFDKSFQFIVGRNGRFGVNGEHSGLDGYPVHRLISFIYDQSGSLCGAENYAGRKSKSEPQKLKFYFDSRLRQIISRAKNDFGARINDTLARAIDFREFGKERIKSFEISPDAFVQLALQLAMYRLFGTCKSIYEVASTRRFLHGRTESLRTVSTESLQFIKNMLSTTCDSDTKIASLHKAARKHVSRMKACMAGKGVERHLLGILNVYEQQGDVLGIASEPKIFSDRGWLTLRHDTLSTTSNPDPHGVVLSGFGPVVDDGFGICYTTIEDRITITITSGSHMKQSLDQFERYLTQALLEMSDLMHKTCT
jgi:carnitine O-acetyltransferase